MLIINGKQYEVVYEHFRWPYKKALARTINKKIYINIDKILLDKEQVLRHESIHVAQQEEMPWWKWKLIYAWDYVTNLHVMLLSGMDAYQFIRFEKEAFYFQDDMTYLSRRKKNAWKLPFETKTYQLNKQ